MSSQNKKGSGERPTVLGRKAFAAITAVEGLKLGSNGKRRLSEMEKRNLSGDQRRAEVIRAYVGSKKR